MFRNTIIVGTGAALGATARLVATILLGPSDSMWVLLIVNVTGCFFLGAWRPSLFLGTGVLGGYTSFSAFALALVQAPLASASLYLVATALGCVGAWLIGNSLSARGTEGAQS